MFETVFGFNQAESADHPLTKKGIELWLKRVLAFYGENGGVDVELIAGQLLLTDTTADYIYSTDFTPETIRYVPGSRPMLDAIVAEFAGDSSMSDRDKALALMRRCRDNRDAGLARPDLFYGGSEEELLKRGAIMCNEISRVFVCLCQIAGLPARLFASHISGHMMTEVKVSGKWWWIDPMKGIAPVGDDDEPVSAWELKRDPSIIERQPQYVIDDCRPPTKYFGNDERNEREIAYTFYKIRDCYFHPLEATAIGNYFVWDAERYTYPWRIDSADPDGRREAVIQENLNRREAGWPEYYFTPTLMNAPFHAAP